MGSALRQQGDGIDGRAVRFLLKRNLALKKKEARRREMEEEEYERRMLELNRCRVRDDAPLDSAEHEAWRRRAIFPTRHETRMKSEKKKKRLPRVPHVLVWYLGAA